MEVLVAIGLFILLTSSVIGIMFVGFSSTKQGADYIAASGLLQEGIEAVRSIRNRNFAELVDGAHGLTTTSGYYELSGTSDSLLGGAYTRTITIEDVLRDGSGDIAGSGTEDVDTREVTVNVTWETLEGKTQNIDAVFYVYDFTVSQQSWVQTSTADFNNGGINSTLVQAGSGNGEVVLRTYDETWGGLVQQDGINTDGSGDPVAIYFDQGQNTLFTLSTNTSGSEFMHFDVSDVSNSTPTEIGGYDVGGAVVYDFAIADGYAYIATADDSIEVDVVRISDMTQVNTIDVSGSEDALSVAVTGNTLLIGTAVAGAGDELLGYDISTPEGTISLVNSTNIGQGCVTIATDGSFAYCGTTSDAEEVFAVRLSDYVEVNSVNLTGTGNVNDVFVQESVLYIGRDDGSTDPDFLSIDISAPASSFAVANSVNTASTVNGIYVDTNSTYAYLATADDSQELTIVDLATLTEAQTFNTSGTNDGQAVAQFGTHIYHLTGSDTDELKILKNTETAWGTVNLVGSANLSTSTSVRSLVVDGNYAYLGLTDNAGSEFFIYDISTPSSPTYIGELEVNATVYDIYIDGDYAYLGTDHNLAEFIVVDISTKSSPSGAVTVNVPGARVFRTLAVTGNTLYIGAEFAFSYPEFFVVDISTPTSPSGQGFINLSDTIYDITINGNYVYAATASGRGEIGVINVTNPSSLSVSYLNLSGTMDAFNLALRSDDVLIVGRDAGSGNELVQVDVSTPSSPSEIDGVDIGTTEFIGKIELDTNDYAFLGVGNTGTAGVDGFQRWDITDAANMTEISTYDFSADPGAMFFDGTYLHFGVNDSSQEYHIYESPSTGSDVPREAVFASEAFDSGSTGTTWDQLDWTSVIGGGGGPVFQMEVGSTTVDHSFSTVNLENTYTSPVVTMLYMESANTEPISVRIDNLVSDSFDVRLQSANGASPLSSDTVYYMVVEEGNWTMPDGTIIEAGTLDTSTVAYKSNWSGTNVSYASTFASAPVVFHQVQTYNDSGWINTFISRPSSRTNPPNTSGFDLALNGAEAVTSHSTETIGWIAIETGTGTIDGVDFEAATTSDSVKQKCAIFSFSNSYASAPIIMVDQLEMDGNDGSWGIGCSLSTSQIGMRTMEDNVGDSEQNHTGETYGYAAFESAFSYTTPAAATLVLRVRTASSEAGLSTATWVGSDGTEDTSYATSGAAMTIDPGASGTRWFQYGAFYTSDSAIKPALQDVTVTYSP